jgi:2-C-methyl-D-erythritol 4-phosphate cytidylyltransferase
VKFLLIDFKNNPTIGYIDYSPENGVDFSDRKEFKNIDDVTKNYKEESCILIDELSGDASFVSVSIKRLLDYDYKITTKNITNAIKTIDSSGKVTSHLDRDKYKRLSTPIKIEMKSLKNYFDNFSEWNFENYLKLNNFTYKQYQEVEEGLTLESK